ncbi:hypothetical protein DPX16_20109 [Anabarilius grahami]|uniref:Uncharacterized protein n=1 Tax=Anabarilius grahami TaxID=495550 RepID=A0A3N0XQT4_ANAGA|nr:hypothetical protein DPX16_20109 [Anabarilius grahami]
MAEPEKKPKKVLSEEAKKRKRESDRTQARTQINIGRAYTQWRKLKEATGCKTDGDLAFLLLDLFGSLSFSLWSDMEVILRRLVDVSFRQQRFQRSWLHVRKGQRKRLNSSA